MIKCYTCNFHQQEKHRHTCDKCETRVVYGEIMETIIDHCPLYKPNKKEADRIAFENWVKRKPIKD